MKDLHDLKKIFLLSKNNDLHEQITLLNEDENNKIDEFIDKNNIIHLYDNEIAIRLYGFIKDTLSLVILDESDNMDLVKFKKLKNQKNFYYIHSPIKEILLKKMLEEIDYE